MFNVFSRFKKNNIASTDTEKKEKPFTFDSWDKQVTDFCVIEKQKHDKILAEVNKNQFKPSLPPMLPDGVTMDSAPLAAPYATYSPFVPTALLSWFGSQGYIGSQFCAILSQHWLISRCCTIPVEDAVRKGYEVTANSGEKISPEILNDLRNYDDKYRIHENLVEFGRNCNIFGIRIAFFNIEHEDPEMYYEKPFNLDGVLPYSYKSITQRDPNWVTPQLDIEAASNPISPYFQDPTWWVVSGRKHHREHLAIIRTENPPDSLKPAYNYGGVPLPQRIYERVYAAERTANEAPMLAVTKRMLVQSMDVTQIIPNQQKFEERMRLQEYCRDNYGTKFIGAEETIQQLDTSLTDFDSLITSQYQLVAGQSGIPLNKLLGTPPKGFSSTGEYEESSYHEMLEGVQIKLTWFLQRHYDLLIRSEICPKYGIAPFSIKIVWEKLDSLTEQEAALVNKTNAETDAILIASNTIDNVESRDRIIKDPNSGYNGLSSEVPEELEEDSIEELEEDSIEEQENNYLDSSAL